VKRFLLLSDIHATDVDPSSSEAPSYVSSFNAGGAGRLDPIQELHGLFADQDSRPDYILCAGDITNRSNPASLTYALERLSNLANTLGAKLITTVGNHDIDSRFQANKFDPRGYAMSVKPSIPVTDRTQYLEFWAENFTAISDGECNFLVLNTAAYHGGGDDAKAEIEHGRISEVTIAAIRKAAGDLPDTDFNILLCHHHPIKGDIGDKELIGQTRGGEQLVTVLEGLSGHWIVVHGHKHVPDLYYGHGGSNAPLIMSCASFSAQVNRDAQNKNPNQVHLLCCEPKQGKALGQRNSGRVLSWTWQAGVGWRKAREEQGLPHRAGFGYRNDPDHLAKNIDAHLTELDLNQISWADAVSRHPQIQWLIPSDLTRFDTALEALGLCILEGRSGNAEQIGRTP
jgi:predicted MPP superfamily phosphohydrolase